MYWPRLGDVLVCIEWMLEMENTGHQKDQRSQYYFIVFIYSHFKSSSQQADKKHDPYNLIHLGVSTPSDSLILWELPSISRELPLDHLEAGCLTYGALQQQLLRGGESVFLIHLPHL